MSCKNLPPSPQTTCLIPNPSVKDIPGTKYWLIQDFSGHTKDWIEFERDFRAVATSQGIGNILKSEMNFPTTTFGQSNYILDSALIYNVLQCCWTNTKPSHIIQQHAASKDGRQLYLDAQLHFRVKDTVPSPSTARINTQSTCHQLSPCDCGQLSHQFEPISKMFGLAENV